MLERVWRAALIAAYCTWMFGCQTSGRVVAPWVDATLQEKVQSVVHGFEGDVGIYVRNLRTGQSAAIRADDIFPTASMIKVPIMCGIFTRIERGEFNYDQKLQFNETLRYDDSLIGSLRDGAQMTLAEAVMQMVSLSDNTASLWLQQIAGNADINVWLDDNGFHETRVNSRVAGREAAQKEYGWGQTTPREMAELLVCIAHGKAVSPGASEEMFRVLSKSYWDKEALSQIPPDVHIAAKSGAVNASRSEVVLVSGPSGTYVFCIITKNQKDQRWEADNAGYVMARRLSRMLWEYFEPDDRWRPQPDSHRWQK